MSTPEWEDLSLIYTNRDTETTCYRLVKVTVFTFELRSKSYRSKTDLTATILKRVKICEIRKCRYILNNNTYISKALNQSISNLHEAQSAEHVLLKSSKQRNQLRTGCLLCRMEKYQRKIRELESIYLFTYFGRSVDKLNFFFQRSLFHYVPFSSAFENIGLILREICKAL